MKNFRPRLVCTALVVVGATISGYLLWRRQQLTRGTVGTGPDVCQAVFGRGCDALLMSPEAFGLGLPVAGWGLIYFAILGVLLLLGFYLRKAFEFEAHFSALLLTLLSLPLSLYLSVEIATGKASFCPLCALTHVINGALAICLGRLTGESWRGLLQAFKRAAGYLLTGRTSDPALARWKLLALFTVLVVALAVYQRVLLFSTNPARSLAGPAPSPQQLFAGFGMIPEQAIPVGPEDATWGPMNAPVQIVVFSEFGCPSCRRFAVELRALVQELPADKLQIVFKHFPLAKACNRSLAVDLHPQACEAAYAAEAARRQGGFWPFHDRLFDSDGATAVDYAAVARAAGLDLPQLEADRRAAATQAKVSADVDLGIRLGVEGTPAIFVNRRRLANLPPQTLRALVDQILANTTSE